MPSRARALSRGRPGVREAYQAIPRFMPVSVELKSGLAGYSRLGPVTDGFVSKVDRLLRLPCRTGEPNDCLGRADAEGHCQQRG
jgi:hypothetical protein